jgi:acyl-CoA thioesterase
MDASRIVSRMYQGDAFSQWLGIEVVHVEPGKAVLSMTVREEMTNGFGIAHGGICYSLADSALAFASNGHGRQALSIDTSIQHLAPVNPGDTLRAEAVEEHQSNRLGHYRVRITCNQNEALVALFKGIVYRTDKPWEDE